MLEATGGYEKACAAALCANGFAVMAVTMGSMDSWPMQGANSWHRYALNF